MQSLQRFVWVVMFISSLWVVNASAAGQEKGRGPATKDDKQMTCGKGKTKCHCDCEKKCHKEKASKKDGSKKDKKEKKEKEKKIISSAPVKKEATKTKEATPAPVATKPSVEEPASSGTDGGPFELEKEDGDGPVED